MHDMHPSGGMEGPVSPDLWKRAVHKSAPMRFHVEMTSSSKQGGSYGFGMKISAIKKGDRSSTSSHSQGSSEYEIWRTWEDCLWFQETLEQQYSRMARDKRNRLVHGRGVKKNGIYIHDHAASFESLPPGPHPDSVARSIHEFVPKLTKKGTVFRASQATIEQRNKEMQALLDGLFQEDVPMLVKELRESRHVTDFFGFWRRDHDHAKKNQPRDRSSKQAPSRSSVSASIFSNYFSSSNPNLLDMPPSPALPNSPFLKPPSPTTTSRPSTAPHGKAPRRPRTAPSRPTTASGAGEASTSTSTSTHKFPSKLSDEDDSVRRSEPGPSTLKRPSSLRDSKESSVGPLTPIITTQDIPAIYQPQETPTDFFSGSMLSSPLEPLPEDSELSPVTPKNFDSGEESPAPTRRTIRTTRHEFQANRNCQIFMTPPHLTGADNTSESTLPEDRSVSVNSYNRSVRESWATGTDSYLEGLDVELPAEPCHRPSASISSVATFMTDSSADAIIPRSNYSSGADLSRSFSAGSRRAQRRLSIREDEVWSDTDEDLINSYIYDPFPQPGSLPIVMESRPETPLGHVNEVKTQPNSPQTRNFFQSDSRSSIAATSMTTNSSSDRLSTFFGNNNRRPSTATSIATSYLSDSPTSPTSPSAGETLAVKAAHNNSIVILRVPRSITFSDMRQRLYNKFVGQEGIPLSDAFTITYICTAPPVKPVHARNRSASLSSVDNTQMQFVTTEGDWENVVAATIVGKLNLRILDTPT